MAQRLRSRATAAIAAGMAATCIGVAAAPAFADTVRNQEWWLTSLHVTKAWLSSRGAGVTVAVLDTGVDTKQPDLAGSVITGRDYTGSGRAAGGPFWGTHGTAVASLIAGHGHGPHHGDGVVGVAPLAKILSVRVTLENKDPLLANPTVVAALPAAIAHGIDYAVRHGAQVIELPLDPAAQAGGTTTGGSPAERAAVKAALRKGVVLVAPSGDNGAGTDTINYPAAYPGVISVGAFSQGFVKAAFTNHQSYATLTAAGDGDIAANGPTAYAKLKSTSAASAVVAGIAALIRSQFPTFTPAQVEQALTSGTVFRPKGGQKTGSGVGTADAAAALVAAAKINATPTSSGSPGSAANPTPPAAPKVTVHTKSLWQAVEIPVLGLAALVLLALIILITVRVRQRRALDAQLAPLQAAARASRAQSAAGMTGMGSPGPGYGGPPAAMTGRGPASSEPVGSGPANFGLGGPEPGSVRLGSSRLAPAGSGFASDDAADQPWAGASEARTGRPMPASVGRPAVSGKPPWEEDDALAPAPMAAPPAPEPSRSGGRFLLPGRGLGGSLDAAGGPGPGGGPAGRGSASADPADRSSTTGSFPVDSSSAGNSAPGNSAAGAESRNSLNLGGWSLGKPASEGGPGGRTGAPGAGNGAGNDAAEAGNRTAGRGITGGRAAGQPAGFPGPGPMGPGSTGAGFTSPGSTGPGSMGAGSTGAGTAGTDSPEAAGGTGNFPGTNATGTDAIGSGATGSGATGSGATGSGATGTGNQNMTTSAGPGGPLAGLGGAGPNAAAAAARARFGPSPFDDPSFEIPAFSPSASDGPAFDDSAFGAPGPGTPLDEPTLGGPALGGPALGRPALGVTPPGVPADSGRPGTTAGTGGTRGSGRHGAARGSSSGNPPVSGGADADSSSLGRTGDTPAQPMRTLGSAHRLNAVRGPRAAAHPPWEPAEKPASELPWMDAPASGPNRMAPPRRVFPAGTEGQAAGSAGGLGAGQTAGGQTAAGQAAAGEMGTGETGSGRPASADPADPGRSMTASGLVRRRPKSQSPFPDLAGPPAGRAGPPASGPAEDAEEPRPMYSWNPSDPTEAFPAVPPPGDSRPG
ncbi:MAG TPA: S8 family serine peptidase [Streptosporangiaceae bacterium]|nr:S8 family serine peptidase [Streptosporangiaceae bacterium]